jgi:hypothetical protein
MGHCDYYRPVSEEDPSGKEGRVGCEGKRSRPCARVLRKHALIGRQGGIA